jgi:hypothetical protein
MNVLLRLGYSSTYLRWVVLIWTMSMVKADDWVCMSILLIDGRVIASYSRGQIVLPKSNMLEETRRFYFLFYFLFFKRLFD